MKRYPRLQSRLPWALALLATALVGSTVPGTAQAPPTSRVSFKATAKGAVSNLLVVPKDPPVASLHVSVPGQSAVLGAFTYTGYSITRQDVDSLPKSDAGVGTLTAPNGDALFIEFSSQIRGSFALSSEGTFVITGGKGQYLGASGSGVQTGLLDPIKREISLSWDGVIVVPKR
jgi:hypothetical protein